MPSLWDLLCVSPQQKYSTYDERSTRRPHDRRRHHGNRHHDNQHESSNVMYHYIQPDIHYHRPTSSPTPTPPHQHPPLSLYSHAHDHQDPRSPAYRKDFMIPGDDPRSPWYVGAPDSRPPPPSSPRRDVMVQDNRLVVREEGRLSMEPAPPMIPGSQLGGVAVDQWLGVGGEKERDWTHGGGSSGKRRHVREIFADVNYQHHQSDVSLSGTSVTSSPGQSSAHRQSSGSVQSPGQRLSTGSTQSPGQRLSTGSTQIPGQRLSTGSTQSPGQRLSTGSAQSPRPRETSRSKQISGFLQASESRPSPGLSLNTGTRPPSGSKPTESLYQYSPRTVSDNAVSAALFGNRIDDFVHDPGWNRAIDKFAATPITTNPPFFFGSDKNFATSTTRASSSPTVLSPRNFNAGVTVTNAEPSPSENKDENEEVTQAEPTLTSHPSANEKARETPSVVDEDSRSTRGDLGGFIFVNPQTPVSELSNDKCRTGPGTGTGQEQWFIAQEDVLY